MEEREELNYDEKKHYEPSVFFWLNVIRNLKIEERANKKDDNLFQELYQKELNKFFEKEQHIIETLPQKIEKLNKPAKKLKQAKKNVESDMQKVVFHCLYQDYLDANSFSILPFNVNRFEEKFKAEFEFNLKQIEHIFPSRILNEIPDTRIFCLGYATKEVIEKAQELKTCLEIVWDTIT